VAGAARQIDGRVGSPPECDHPCSLCLATATAELDDPSVLEHAWPYILASPPPGRRRRWRTPVIFVVPVYVYNSSWRRRAPSISFPDVFYFTLNSPYSSILSIEILINVVPKRHKILPRDRP
jgi:hypothetical protein